MCFALHSFDVYRPQATRSPKGRSIFNKSAFGLGVQCSIFLSSSAHLSRWHFPHSLAKTASDSGAPIRRSRLVGCGRSWDNLPFVKVAPIRPPPHRPDRWRNSRQPQRAGHRLTQVRRVGRDGRAVFVRRTFSASIEAPPETCSGVQIGPGATALTRMPLGPSYFASDFT
jgi:hypothetical protein